MQLRVPRSPSDGGARPSLCLAGVHMCILKKHQLNLSRIAKNKRVEITVTNATQRLKSKDIEVFGFGKNNYFFPVIN